jgi:hypothetical protein
MGPALGDVLPKIIYARGDMQTGQKIIVMEDLGDGTVTGDLLGPHHPHTWHKKKEVEASTAGGPGPEAIIEGTFLATAQIHAKHWMSDELQRHEWLALRKQDDKTNWENMMGFSKSLWTKQREGIEGVQINPYLLKVMDASFAKSDWDTHLARLQTTTFTLTQGDFHPFNVVWTKRGAVFLDWEIVSAGSPGQELGQYMVNINPALRRATERRLLEAYREKLVECGVSPAKCRLEDIWEEYVHGGTAKWLWVLPICIHYFPVPEKQQWFCDQVSAFVIDHGVDEANVHQPRKS